MIAIGDITLIRNSLNHTKALLQALSKFIGCRLKRCAIDGEIKIDDDHGKLVWVCPKCGNRDQSKLNVARRTCGYIGTQFWNQGRTQEIKDRVMHLSTLSDISIKGNLSHSSAV